MRKILALMFFVTSFVAFAAEKVTEVFTLDHQMSAMCEKKIKENLRFEKGIDKIDVSLKENTITITYNPDKTDTQKILDGFSKIGFNACLYNAPRECVDPVATPTPETDCCAPAESCCTPAESCCASAE